MFLQRLGQARKNRLHTKILDGRALVDRHQLELLGNLFGEANNHVFTGSQRLTAAAPGAGAAAPGGRARRAVAWPNLHRSLSPQQK